MSIYSRELMQQSNETFEEYRYRILLGKWRGEIDISWSEAAEITEHEKASHARQAAIAISNYIDFQKERLQFEEEPDDDMQAVTQQRIDELNRKVLELKSEQVRLQDQKRILNKEIRDGSRLKHVQDQIKESIYDLAKLKPLTFKPPKEKTGNREAVLMLSDWHKGLNANNYWNQYNDHVFQTRVKHLVSKTIEHAKSNNASVLRVFMLGDLVHGLIHVTTRINSTENVVDQTRFVAETLSYVFTEFSNHFSEVFVYWARGNHERVSANIKESIAAESFFDFVPWYLRARLENCENVYICENRYDEEIIVEEICGYTVFGIHGHRDKITNVVQNLSLMLKKFPDYVLMGHYHKTAENEVHGAEVISNPSLSGVDDYAKEKRLTGNVAQKLLIFDPEEGRLCTYNIKLEKKKKKTLNKAS